MSLRRGRWSELDGDDELILIADGWIGPETLALAIRETGWFPTTWQSFAAAEQAVVTWGWIGTSDMRELIECDQDGSTFDSDEIVTEVVQVTLARIPPVLQT